MSYFMFGVFVGFFTAVIIAGIVIAIVAHEAIKEE